MSVTEAHEALSRGIVYVDVRSTEEFRRGHAVGAVNVPLQEPDEDTGVLSPNPDFIRVMKANFDVDTPLLIGCQAGGRSVRACQMLEAFGFTNVVNVKGGYGGSADPGWEPCGLPTEISTAPGAAYVDLLAKADSR